MLWRAEPRLSTLRDLKMRRSSSDKVWQLRVSLCKASCSEVVDADIFNCPDTSSRRPMVISRSELSAVVPVTELWISVADEISE
jgi:hypothetical protein